MTNQNLTDLIHNEYYWINIDTLWKIRRIFVEDENTVLVGQTPYSHIIERYPQIKIFGPIKKPDAFND